MNNTLPHPRRAILTASLAVGLALVGEAPALTAQSMPRVTGTLRVSAPRNARGEDVTVVATLRNNTGQPAIFPAEVLSATQLMLEVRDARGQIVGTVPPPVPAGATVTIAPGETVQRTFQLTVFSPPLARGRYTVRFRGAVIVGAPVAFTVAR
ncbi:MAG: hypothetical protein JNK05_05165 [Myxococcales bacterium]|nr:hypothetical protein [Myxococcales bacterium]